MANVTAVINPAIKSKELYLPNGSGGYYYFKGTLSYTVDDSLLLLKDAKNVAYLVLSSEVSSGTPSVSFGSTTNATVDATLGNADNTTTDELADVLSTLITELKTRGVISG
jgi:hypothetical protein